MRNLALLEEIGRELRSDPVLIVKRDLALLIGLHEAIILDRLAWISRNRRETANAGEPPWDGWIRGGLGFLRKQFPFISREKIEQTLRWLCELGALQRQQAKPGCPYWYRVDELALRLLEAQAVEGDGNLSENQQVPADGGQAGNQSEFQQVPVGIPAATSRNSSRSQTKGNELFRPSSTTAEPAATADATIKPEAEEIPDLAMKIAVDWCEQVTLELVKNHDPARRLSIPPDKRRSAATMAKGVLYALRQGNVPLEAFQRMQAIAWRTPFWRQAVADMPSWVSGARFCELYNAWRVTRQASEMPPAPLSEAEKAALFAKPEAVKR